MAAETSWHRYAMKLRHCHPMQALTLDNKRRHKAYRLQHVSAEKLEPALLRAGAQMDKSSHCLLCRMGLRCP